MGDLENGSEVSVVHSSDESGVRRPFGVFLSAEDARTAEAELIESARNLDGMTEREVRFIAGEEYPVYRCKVQGSDKSTEVVVLDMPSIVDDPPYGLFKDEKAAEAEREQMIEERIQNHSETVANPGKTLREHFEGQIRVSVYIVGELNVERS